MENSRFAVISDSSCDLPGELTAAKEITVVPFYVSFDGETYKKEGTEIGIREFYREMVEQPGVYPKSFSLCPRITFAARGTMGIPVTLLI